MIFLQDYLGKKSRKKNLKNSNDKLSKKEKFPLAAHKS